MTSPTIRASYSLWPAYNRALRDVVMTLTEAQLAVRPAPDRWPLWATIGHLACQRVFWLCDFAGAPGAAQSPFPDAAFNCPGDDDLEHVWSAAALADALDRTFGMVDWCLDHWTVEQLGDEISHPEWGPGDRTHSRGFAVQRVYTHDVAHSAELNEALGRAGLRQVDLFP
jgi:DinB family protein